MTVAEPVAGGVGTEESYYTQLVVTRVDGSQAWTVVDEWSHWGLGASTPRPFHWSRDGRYLYYTNYVVPDGCPYFQNGTDLQRVDLRNGHVTELAPEMGWWLALSPDEATLAASRGPTLVLRHLASGTEQQVTLPSDGDSAGHIVWSPDGQMLALTVAVDPCGPRQTLHSIVRVDRQTMTPVILVDGDSRLLTTQEWAEAERVLLRDRDGEAWWLDPVRGEVAPVQESERR